ncbi:MAG: hypothetical protein M0Q41_01805 [Bacteroidales bacterium]|nr:hypothetical protein [Bacteroidales bacterium]
MENKERHNIDQWFRENLEHMEITPPPEVWEGIHTRLNRKKRIVFYRNISIAASLLLLIGLVFLLTPTTQKQEKEINQLVTSSETQSSEKQVTAEATPSHSILSTKEDTLATSLSKPYITQAQTTKPTQRHITTDQQSDVIDNQALITEEIDLIAIEEITDSHTELPSSLIIETDKQDETSLAYQLLEQHLESLKEPSTSEEIRSKADRSTNIALVVNSIPTSIGKHPDMLVGSRTVEYGPDPFQSDIGYRTSYFEEIESTTLYPPVSIGFKLSHQLSKRWSIEAGILYTEILTSSKTREFDQNYSRFEQVLIYVGVPLGVRFDLIQTNSMQVYLNHSIVLEKGMRAINRSLYFEKKKLIDAGREFAPISGIQMSNISSLGINVPIYRRISFFGEGGIQIFYLNSTQPFNIRSAKKLWPSIHGGIRIKI